MNRGATILYAAVTAVLILFPENSRGQDGKPANVDKTPTIVELSKVKADHPKATDTVNLDVGKSRFFKVEDYAGPLTWEMTGDALLFKEVEKPTLIGMLQQGEVEPSYPEVPAGAVILWGKRPGTAELSAWGVVGGKPKKLLTKPFVVSGEGPRPPPKPDDPVLPKPDEPKPDGKSPFSEAGFRVMLIFDSSNTTRPSGQQSVLYGKAIRDYLNAKCIESPVATEKNADGSRMREWRIWPANSDTSKVRAVWKDTFEKRGGDDWILIGDGKTGYSGPLPKTEAEALTLLKKYGGA